MGEIQRVRVVLVSPGDVAGERTSAQAVVDELNRGEAADQGCVLSLWRWETDAWPGLHLDGPQGQIDEQMRIGDGDLVVGVFWKRFGTPTHDGGSGTEHELRLAHTAWTERGRPQVMMYFCTRAASPQTPEETDQWGRVLRFRDEVETYGLTARYETEADFERLLREHLGRYLRAFTPPAGTARSARGGVAAAADPRVRFNLPFVAASFTGRESDLLAIDEALGVADRAVLTQAITGLGGVGKSHLAARYAQAHADRYDVVAWIRAEDGEIGDLAKLAAKLGLVTDELSPSQRAQLALDWLADTRLRWLLVLDNIECAAQLPGLLPRGGSGRVLVTSRDRALKQFGPMLEVDVFDEDTATRYLTERAGRPDDEASARKLAQALGCLPLALSHAAAFCQSGTTFDGYLELLEQLPARELFDQHPEESYAHTVASTWKASIAASNTDAPLAGDVLAMAAYLRPNAIPKTLFGVLVDDATTARERKRLVGAFNALARYSLATIDDTTVNVHRLLQKVIRDTLTEHADQAAARRALDAVDHAFPQDTTAPTGWPRCEQLLPHALMLADTVSSSESATKLIGLLCRVSDYVDHSGGGSRARAADHLYHFGGGSRGVAAFERLANHARVILGAEHPDTLSTRHGLAHAYKTGGRISEAIDIYERLLPDRERILGAGHPHTLRTRHGLAHAYKTGGRISEAIDIYERLLADRERILGAGHPDTLRSRHGLAHAYQVGGRISEAIEIYERLLADRERILGAGHPHTLKTRHGLANAYKTAGRTADAERVPAQPAP